MKKFYEAPEVVEVTFHTYDVITASNTEGLGGITTEDDPNGGWGGFN